MRGRGRRGCLLCPDLRQLRCGWGRPVHSVGRAFRRGRPADFFRLLAALAGGGALLCGGRLVFHLTWRRGARWVRSAFTRFPSRKAIAALASLSVLVAGRDLATTRTTWFLEIVVLYLLVVTAILLILMVTPDRAEYFKGSEASQQARPRPPALVGRPGAQPGVSRDRVRHRAGRRDRGRAAAVRYVGPAPAWAVSSPGNFPLAIAIGVLVVGVFRAGASVLLAAVRPARQRPTSLSFCSWRGWFPWWPARSWRWRRRGGRRNR